MRDAPKVVVLDDDPTGTQTVSGVPVLTAWDTDTLAAELGSGLPGFFVLTNTRALLEEKARALNAEIGTNLVAARERTDRSFVVISRSDSTLRGHFPAEVEALATSIGLAKAPVLLCPYFEAGGRITRGDIHYVRDGAHLVPVGETEFARDATFGFSFSDLKQWVEEKTGGRFPASEVNTISLEEIRTGGVETVTQRLEGLLPGSVCILNCERPGDLDILVAAALRAEEEGCAFMYRSAAQFAAARMGITPRPLLSSADLSLPPPPCPGTLVVVGSYVEKSTLQLEALLAGGEVMPVEISIAALLSSHGREAEIDRVARASDAVLATGRDVAVYTSREHVFAGDLTTGNRISQALVSVVRQITTRPRCLIAKGGITSSDIATKALGVRRAMVLGQIGPGVPVWRMEQESRWPGALYVVFPGNVGTVETLADICRGLRV